MARTQEQIIKRIQQLYPAVWVYNTLEEGQAVWQAIAAIFSTLEEQVDSLISSAYILQASGNQLDLHAKGRGLVRGESEPDSKLQERIRSWEDKATKPALEAGMNALLTTQGAYIDENLPDGGFYDRQKFFFDRDQRYYDDKFLIFTAWVPWQEDALILDAFYDRQIAFYDRQDAFLDDLQNPDQSIYKRIYQYLDTNRAAGVRFNMFIF